ncbi:hypothetical protein K3727_06280 [Rhodobacteraceae bacterium M382]|nr:hypothetical protein K3727_06280 [Rhodobacteraceae bacterium M382]
MDNVPLNFSCTCGEVRGVVDITALRDGAHIACFCPDCRAGELFFDQPDPAPGPVALFQTAPDRLTFLRGQDKLGLMRLGPNGLFRWYATCCNTPIGNTLKTHKLPFVGIPVARFAAPERLGPVQAQGFIVTSDGKKRHKGAGRMVWRMFSRFLSAWMSGRWRNTPFFDVETGKPVAKAKIPTREERAALYR